MPSYKMQYEDKDGNKLDKPIKVLVHKTEPPQPGGQKDLPEDGKSPTDAEVESALVAHFKEQALSPDEKPPKVADLKADYGRVTKATRDRAWSTYTLELQVAGNTDNNQTNK